MSFYYHLAAKQDAMSLIMVLKTTYDEYRTTTYDPTAKISSEQTYDLQDEVSSWKKNIILCNSSRHVSRTLHYHKSSSIYLIDINRHASTSIRSNDGIRSSKIPFKLLKGHRYSHINQILEIPGKKMRTL
jgi:hypothetical protein